MKGEQVLTLLGEDANLMERDGGRFLAADLVAEGLHRQALQRVKEAMALSDVRLAALIGISQKTISRLRKNPEGKLAPVPSDRLYRVASVFSLATEVLGSVEEARHWLEARQVGLNGRIPLELLASEVGTREVENLLGRIEYGVLS